MPDLYKKLREADGSLPTPCKRFFRLADGACVERRTDYHPDWVRFLAETENETVNIADADPVPPPGLAELAENALDAVNWQGWKDRITAGRSAVVAMGNDTTGIPNATTRNRFVQLFGGLLDAHEATGRMLHDILVALSKTDDQTPL